MAAAARRLTLACRRRAPTARHLTVATRERPQARISRAAASVRENVHDYDPLEWDRIGTEIQPELSGFQDYASSLPKTPSCDNRLASGALEREADYSASPCSYDKVRAKQGPLIHKRFSDPPPDLSGRKTSAGSRRVRKRTEPCEPNGKLLDERNSGNYTLERCSSADPTAALSDHRTHVPLCPPGALPPGAAQQRLRATSDGYPMGHHSTYTDTAIPNGPPPDGMSARIADDLLVGADAIAEEIGVPRRRVYNLVEKGLLPCIHEGATIVASRSRLRQHYASMLGAK